MGGAARVHAMRHSFPGLAFFSYGLVNMECLQAGRQRVVYLITYSRADVVKFPSKESFSNAVLQAWQNFGVRVVQWVTCIEAHHNTDNGEHEQNIIIIIIIYYLFGANIYMNIFKCTLQVTLK